MSAPAPSPAQTSSGLGVRWTYAILATALLFVLMPFLFWQGTWFGRPLSDEEIRKHLADGEHPRKTQHALAQIAERIEARDAAVKHWYPQVVALTTHKVDEIRITAAWVMGKDNAAKEFQWALRDLLRDAHPMVRRNAALSLVRFGDPAGRDEITGMLRPFAVATPFAGVLSQRLKPGDAVNPGTLLARATGKQGEIEVRSPVPGTLKQWLRGQDADLVPGEEIVLISPSAEVIFEALRALVFVGQPLDLLEIERYAAGVPGMPDSVQQQAALTVRAIRSRSVTSVTP